MNFRFNSRTKRLLAVSAVGLIALPLAVPSRMDGLIPVFDAGSYAMIGKVWAQDISTYAKMVQTVVALQKIYVSGMQLYSLGQQEASYIRNKNLFAAVGVAAQYSAINNLTGETSGWATALKHCRKPGKGRAGLAERKSTGNVDAGAYQPGGQHGYQRVASDRQLQRGRGSK